MKQTLRILGVSLVVACAFGGASSSTASAADFHSIVEHTHIVGVSKVPFTIGTTAGSITCEKGAFTHTELNGKTTTETTLEVIGTGCHIIIFGSTVSATLNMNGCKYKINSEGTVDIDCPAGKSISVTAAGCTVTIGAQTGLKTVSYSNNGNHIDAKFNLSGLKYSHSGFTCGTGSASNGTHTGEITLEGENTSGEEVKIWHE